MRVHPGNARHIWAVLPRLGPLSAAALFAFDGGYDPVQLSVELAGSGAQIVVRVRDDRTYFARPVPHAGGRGGRPRRHGAKFACADPGTWPTPDVILETDDDVCGRVESRKPRSRPRNGETDDKREA